MSQEYLIKSYSMVNNNFNNNNRIQGTPSGTPYASDKKREELDNLYCDDESTDNYRENSIQSDDEGNEVFDENIVESDEDFNNEETDERLEEDIYQERGNFSSGDFKAILKLVYIEEKNKIEVKPLSKIKIVMEIAEDFEKIFSSEFEILWKSLVLTNPDKDYLKIIDNIESNQNIRNILNNIKEVIGKLSKNKLLILPDGKSVALDLFFSDSRGKNKKGDSFFTKISDKSYESAFDAVRNDEIKNNNYLEDKEFGEKMVEKLNDEDKKSFADGLKATLEKSEKPESQIYIELVRWFRRKYKVRLKKVKKTPEEISNDDKRFTRNRLERQKFSRECDGEK